ncbi:hypothetical protein [Ancylobacter polymorphus]|uniref:Uncharacterized protein n=1 Tax=Ancylobacter polymorphus TaxID=223390 RepID=A0A9E7CXN7_9HYPH|nr:hypothetical protein [Ancylobacter polymorphus]UOK73973.1 hypothetical protein K9D25_24845 [Ancylobacter polymorphus]
MSDKPSRALRTLRAFSNLVVVVGLLLLADWTWAWWNSTGTVACRSAWALGSDASQALIGMGGLLLAMAGVMLGGARHPLTGLGLLVMIVGLALSGMAPALLEGVCARP